MADDYHSLWEPWSLTLTLTHVRVPRTDRQPAREYRNSKRALIDTSTGGLRAGEFVCQVPSVGQVSSHRLT